MCPTRPSQAPSLPYLHGFHERERERFRRARDAANTATAPATSSIYEYSAAGRGRPLFLFPQLQLRTGRTGSCCSSSATTSPPPATLLQKQKKLLILNSGRQGLVHQRSAFRSRVFFPSALALAASCRVPFPPGEYLVAAISVPRRWVRFVPFRSPRPESVCSTRNATSIHM